MPRERRGGDSCGDKFKEINTQKTWRLYMHCDLSFSKLHKMQKPHSSVKKSYFRTYVHQNYNLSFGTPLCDACSTCLRAKETLEKQIAEEEKLNLITEQRVHKSRTKALYTLLKSESHHLQIFSFDCRRACSYQNYHTNKRTFRNKFYNSTLASENSKSSLSPTNPWFWNTRSDAVLKKPCQWHFKCNKSKRSVFSKQIDSITVRREVFYRSHGMQSDKSSIDTLPEKHYGPEWRTDPDLRFYKIIDMGLEPNTNDCNPTEADHIDDYDHQELRV
nr:unnamed protein product [Callosobruchus analis]